MRCALSTSRRAAPSPLWGTCPQAWVGHRGPGREWMCRQTRNRPCKCGLVHDCAPPLAGLCPRAYRSSDSSGDPISQLTPRIHIRCLACAPPHLPRALPEPAGLSCRRVSPPLQRCRCGWRSPRRALAPRRSCRRVGAWQFRRAHAGALFRRSGYRPAGEGWVSWVWVRVCAVSVASTKSPRCARHPARCIGSTVK
eukprot:350989-Chlamydomonas_euryale.AAC.2